MQLIDYARKHYRKDLQNFARAYTRSMEWHLVAPNSPSTPPARLEICSCSLKLVEQAMQAGLHDVRLFAIDLATEAMLFAGVHSYDRANHERYVRKLGATVKFVLHGTDMVLHPQLLLLGGGKWRREDAGALREGVTALLRAWAPAYSKEFGERRGEAVLSMLAQDRDIRANPGGLLPAGTLKAFLEGVEAAAEGDAR